MKAKIHPNYNATSAFTCSNCKSVFNVGSTMKELLIETCSQCHHFWTGTEKDISKTNRSERFAKRMAQAVPVKKAEATN